MKACLTAILVALTLVTAAHADAPVWKVSGNGQHLFIGGTMHVLQAEDYPLPEEFEAAYQAAERLVFEVDTQNAGSLQFQQVLLDAALYTDGSSLATHLQAATLSRLRAFMNQRGIPVESVLPFRVGLLVTLLTVNELQRHGIQGMGVDQFFSERAARDVKSVASLETVEQQIQFIAHMGAGEEDQIVLQTLEELDDFASEFDQLKAAWRVELAEMRGRLREMRVLLSDALREKAPDHDFSHLVRAKGMFCFLGIGEDQVNRLKKEYGVYMVGSSRINMAGITAKNVNYLADAIAATL